jgi:RNaseH domain of pPIWI_RE/pPIWI_RE module N-terminal domain/MID domain of pPIWI_RE
MTLTQPASPTPITETYTRRKDPADPPPTPLAFVLDLRAEHAYYTATIVRWTEPVRQLLGELDRAYAGRSPRQSLPVEALRGRIEVLDPDNERLDRDLGRWKEALLVTACAPDQAAKRMHHALRGWLAQDVRPEGQSESALVERLRQLARDGTAVTIEVRTPDVFAWEAAQNGTAAPGPGNENGYADLADYVARGLQGREIVAEVPALRRIAGRELTANQAELMTPPISRGKASFSIVVRIKVFSYPGRSTPVVAFELSRRVWVRSLRPSHLVRRLTGYAFPADTNTALPFTLELTKSEDPDKPAWTYEPMADLAPIARAHGLPVNLRGEHILVKGPLLEGCRLCIVHKNGLAERAPAKQGIPDSDKLDAFRRAAEVLAAAGLRPWEDLVEVDSPTRPIADKDQWWREPEKHVKRIEEEIRAIGTCYDRAHSFLLAYHPWYRADAEFAEATMHRLLGDRVRIQAIPLPPDVHGPRAHLPETRRKPTERAEARMRAWLPFIEEARRFREDSGWVPDGILVLAPQWYDQRPDDMVNKRAARIALTRALQVPVQYLRPIEDNWGRLAGDEKAQERFLQRLLIAWSDLVWKTIGRVKDERLRDAAATIYKDTPDVLPPDRVLAVGVLRKNATVRLWNEGSFVPFAIELDTASGICEARFARERGSAVETTASVPLREALALVAESGPIQLSADPKNRREQRRDRATRFFHAAITEFCRRSERPLVLIDAVACRDVWPWVADSRVDAENVVLGDHPHAEADWGDVRLVRFRTGNAPKVLYPVIITGTGKQTGEVIQYADPDAAQAQLFRLADATVPVYLSFGSFVTKRFGGASCYRTITRLKTPQKGPRIYVKEDEAPWTNAWATPSGVEFAVLRTAAGEDPDQLARYVEQLRILFGHVGGWTTKPAPLHFETALREYLADYARDDEATEMDEEGDDAEQDAE